MTRSIIPSLLQCSLVEFSTAVSWTFVDAVTLRTDIAEPLNSCLNSDPLSLRLNSAEQTQQISRLLPPSTKEYNDCNRADQTSLSLIKFVVNNINIYVFK